MADLNKKQPPEVFYKKCLRPTTLLTTDSDKGVSCELCEIFKNIFFKEHLWATASVEFKTANLHKIFANLRPATLLKKRLRQKFS